MAPPRSVADATRFTPNVPHVHSSSGGETPQERVARLRAAAKKAKLENVSTFERILDRGRVWADRAHRITALGLMGATVLCGGLTIYAYTDMVIYNRRRRKEFVAAQKAIEAEEDAQAAAAGAGEALAAKEQGPGIIDRIKAWSMSGLTPPEKEYRVGLEKTAEEEELRKARPVMDAVEAAEASRASTAAAETRTPLEGADGEADRRKGWGWWPSSGK